MTALPRLLRLLPLAVAHAVMGAAASPALAQTPGDRAAAEALFRQGRKLLEAGRYAEACAKLAESERLDPAPGTLLNLGGCYEKEGKTASAWATFGEAAAASHEKGRLDWEQLARSRAAALEPALSRLTISVPVASKAGGLRVTRDGEDVRPAEWGTPIPVDPGTHVVDARAPGRRPFHQAIDVAAGGASATVTVGELGPAAEAPAASPASDATAPAQLPEARGGSTQRTLGLVVAGAGVVGLGVGAAFGLVAMSKENQALHDDCTADRYCNAAGLQLGQDAHTAAAVSTVAFGVGAAALAGGLVLYFTAPKGEGAAPPVALRAAPARGGASLGLEGAW